MSRISKISGLVILSNNIVDDILDYLTTIIMVDHTQQILE